MSHDGRFQDLTHALPGPGAGCNTSLANRTLDMPCARCIAVTPHRGFGYYETPYCCTCAGEDAVALPPPS